MPNLRLTEVSVKALKGSEKYETYWDTTTPGFGVRVGKRSKTWTSMRGAARERITIGKVGDVSLADARAEAKRLLLSEPEPKAVAMTFAAARVRFLEENYRTAKPRTKDEAKRILEKHFKAIETKKLDAVDDTDVSRALNKLASTPSEQLHAYRSVRCFLRWCTRPPRRYLRHSPMEGYEPPSTDRRGTRILTDDELVAVWNAAESYPHSIIRLLALWGTRNTETTLLERAWDVDGVLTIPGEFTKNGRDHAIPVCPLARSILDGCRESNEYFFSGRWGGQPL